MLGLRTQSNLERLHIARHPTGFHLGRCADHLCSGSPNITGTYHVQSDIGAINRTGSVSGSFYKDGGEYYAVNGDITANGAQKLALSANRSSEIYGSSTVVQPASLRSLVCIKI